MSSYLRQKYQAGKYILQKEGLLPLVEEVIRLLRKCVFVHERYFMYEMPLNEPMKYEAAPKIPGFVFEIVPTNQRLNELAALGFDFGIHGIRARDKLDKGALMFCIFIGKELASIHWAAVNQEAANTLVNGIVYRKGFSNNEAYLGWSVTNPRYRRLGLSMYLSSEKQRLLKAMGKTTLRWMTEKGNLASRKLTIKTGGMIYAEARYLKILWWKSWKEKPAIQQAGQPQPTEKVGAR
jgi:hypothetical protein